MAVAVAAAVIAGIAVLRRSPTAPPAPSPSDGAPAEPAAAPPPPGYMGHAACVGCHAGQAEAWRGSQHARAMQLATPETVLGRFEGTRFTHGGITSTFFRRDGRYFVRTDAADGKPADFEVRYTFGVFPLQQYLIPFPDGRMQALSIAWDSRPQAAGGQRWFHLYPNERIGHRDELHWTGLQQSWNFVCADCHSTNLRRNYDARSDRYATTWTDLSVGCEACHGPGSNHVAWAERRPGWDRLAERNGLAIPLDERRGVTWPIGASGNASRSRPLGSRREVETCGVCHARRRPLGDEPGPTGVLLDTHDVSLLDERLYFADGQQHDEVYTYGSFLQSRMYASGVTCSDCHDPHTQALRAPGNAVCAQCHAPAKYDVRAHTLHAAGSAGASCVACHMPARTYMVIDPRHDHSIRIPRPDQTERYGVPNACNGCHTDRDAGWAAAAIERAHGPDRKGFQTFLDALDAGRKGTPGAQEKLAALIRDAATPAIARATALRLLAGPAAAAVERGLADPDALVRTAGLEALRSTPLPATLADTLVDDPVKAVRLAAGHALATAERTPRRERAVAAYVASEEAMAERPEAHLNLGILYAERGEAARAEAEYRLAMRRQSDFVPAYANLADLYRAVGRDDDAAAVLEAGLRVAPDAPSLLLALGLTRVRERRMDDALSLLRRAATAAPENARFSYVYAVSLHSAGRPGDAMAVLRKALDRSPYDPDLLLGLATFSRDAGQLPAARRYAERLAAVAPGDERATGLLRELDGRPER